jgi:hypothetical protein
LFRLFECCALSFFERFVLSFSLKIERFVSDSAEIWICGLYLKFDNNPFPLLYYCDLYDWDYTKAPIHRREEYYTYKIKKSDDGNDISHFDIAINSRGFGDPPYEGPEYEKYINIENQ